MDKVSFISQLILMLRKNEFELVLRHRTDQLESEIKTG